MYFCNQKKKFLRAFNCQSLTLGNQRHLVESLWELVTADQTTENQQATEFALTSNSKQIFPLLQLWADNLFIPPHQPMNWSSGALKVLLRVRKRRKKTCIEHEGWQNIPPENMTVGVRDMAPQNMPLCMLSYRYFKNRKCRERLSPHLLKDRSS